MMIWQDVRYMLKVSRKNPGFAAATILILSLGIGSSVMIFSFVDALLLRPLPYTDSDRLVIVLRTNAAKGIEQDTLSFADFIEWRTEGQIFEQVTLYQRQMLDFSGAGDPERLPVALVSEDFFAATRPRPLIGRTLIPEDSQGVVRGIVLSDALWKRRFGEDPQIIGKTIYLSGAPHVVVGVIPKNSQWPAEVDLWIPLPFGVDNAPEMIKRRDNFLFHIIARLKKGVTLQQAQARMEILARQNEIDYPEALKGWGVRIQHLQEWVVSRALRLALLLLFGMVCFIQLIACINATSLLLARASMRHQEIATRVALGCGRWRLTRQLLTESLVLTAFAGTCGYLLAYFGIRVLIALAPTDTPRLQEVSIDYRVFIFGVVISCLTAVACGIIPAIQVGRFNLTEYLKAGARQVSGGRQTRRIHSLLIVCEVAISFALLIGSGLIVKSYVKLLNTDPGLRVENLMTMQIALPVFRYLQENKVIAFHEAALRRIEGLPEVQSACISSTLPLGGGGGFHSRRLFLVQGQSEPPAGTDYPAQWTIVSSDYFRTMGIELLKGRAFGEQEREGRQPVIIINEVLARRMFPGENPLGKQIRSWRDENIPREVVGVVSDVRYFGLSDGTRGIVYIPLRQDLTLMRSVALTVRAQADPQKLINAIRREIAAEDKDLAVVNVRSMENILARSVSGQKFNMLLASLFAAIALALMVTGIYGVISYSTSQRSHEVGVRMALGAQKTYILGLVIGQNMRPVLIGLTVGLTASLLLTRLVSTLLYGVTPTDPATFASVFLLILTVSLLACYLPAHRMTKVNPVAALRQQ